MEIPVSSRARALENAVARLDHLPSMPQVVAEVLHLMQDDSADALEVGAAIERDPALAAKILRLANSAYYGLKRQVGSVRLALVVLGMHEVRNVVVGISLLETARAGLGEDPMLQGMWAHCLEVAALSKRLASELRLGVQGEDFIGGLLHDVGKAVLLSQFGAEYRRLWQTSRDEELPKLERERYGCTHAVVGAALLHHWSLPESLVDALWYHHASDDLPLERAKDPVLAAVVRLSNLAAHDDLSRGLGACHACIDAEAWAQLDRTPGTAQPEHRFRILAPFMEQIREIPVLALI